MSRALPRTAKVCVNCGAEFMGIHSAQNCGHQRCNSQRNRRHVRAHAARRLAERDQLQARLESALGLLRWLLDEADLGYAGDIYEMEQRARALLGRQS